MNVEVESSEKLWWVAGGGHQIF